MAMPRETIAQVRELANQLNASASEHAGIGLGQLGSNAASFQDFLQKTEGGQDFFQKYNELTKILQEFFAQVEAMGSAVEDTLSQQEGVNS